jgi:predicted DNA-binding protein (MmcQ/YjbR family)
MGQDLHQAVRDACLWLPESEEHLSHGSPNFRVRGKGFASYMVNHHGDGRVALWLAAASGAQDHYVGTDPQHFFIPPYVGTRGWLGVRLDRRADWRMIAALVREAYEKVAPASLTRTLGRTPVIAPPTQQPAPGVIDPMRTVRGSAMLRLLRKICLPLPETQEVLQFGQPVWQAARKTYAGLRWAEQRLNLAVWVGIEQQGMLVADERYRIPPYTGHNGWIALDVTAACDAAEARALVERSYHHFALKRMLKQLPGGGTRS